MKPHNPTSPPAAAPSGPKKLKEVAQHFGVHPDTVRRWFRKGAGRKIQGRIYFDLDELDRRKMEGGR